LTLFSDANRDDNGVIEQDESGDILLVLDENFVFAVADMDLVRFRLFLIVYLALILYLATFYRVAYG